MSHIEVPPLKRSRSDYRPDYRPSSTTLPTIVNKRRVAHKPLHEVLQKSMQDNADLGVFPGSLDKQKRKPMKQRRDGVADIVVGHPTGTKKMLKRSIMDDNADWGPPSRIKKRPRPISESMVVDLTITDDDDHAFPPPRAKSSSTLASQNPRGKVKLSPKLPVSKPVPRPRPLKKSKFIHAKYDSETDIVTLCLEDIRPVPLEILTLNTRFLRQSLGNDVYANKDNALGPGYIRQNGSRPCLLIAADPSSTMDSLEEVSVGGVIRELLEEWVEKEVIEILSESDALKENVPRKDVPSVPTPLVPSLKNPHQKKPREPHIKPKQRHHPTGDDINKSSSTFKAPAPRAIPDTTQYPKTQYPRKKGREPQHDQQQQPKKQKQASGKDIHGSSTIPVQISPPKVKPAPQHPKKPLESQLLHNDSPVRPPHSARSSLNGQTFGSDYFSGAMPSAKALGKRRAISPMSISGPTTPHRHPDFPVLPYSAASIRDIQLASSTSTPTHNPYILLNSDLNAFINDPSAISPAVQSSSVQANGANSINTFSLSSTYHPLDTLTSLYDQAASSSRNQSEIHIGSDMDSSRHTSTHSHVLAYDSQPQSGSGSRGESFFSSADFLNDDLGFPGDQRDQELQQQLYETTVDGAWSSSLVGNQPEDQYAYETIDPTLLGGGAVSEDAESELDAEIDMVGMEAGFDDRVPQKDRNSQDEVDVRLPDNESSLTDSSYSSTSPQAKKTYQKKKVEETYERKLPPRNRRKRVIPDMLSHDDIDLMIKRKRAAKKANNIRLSISSTSSAPDGDRSSSGSEFDGSDDEEKPASVRKPIPISQPRESLKDPIERSISPPIDKKVTASRAERQGWQMDEVDSCCHQCRRKTFYAKMTCSDCQKKFCVRCYATRCVSFFELSITSKLSLCFVYVFRYPECEFDADDEEYSCPACEGFCNCTVCCRKRGEPYVGVRTCDKSTPPRPRPRNTNVERVKLGAKTNLPLSTTMIQTTTIPKGATNTWGSLYSVTGEKIGACFFDPSAEKDSSVVFAPATTPIMTTMAEVAQQQVAAPPPTSEPKVQVKRRRKHKRRIFIGVVQDCWGYTKPRIRQLEAEPYSKRSYNSMPRYYVGKKKYLFYPVEDDESSLTAMDESDEAPELGRADAEGLCFKPFFSSFF